MLTTESTNLFISFVEDAPNWSGQPMVDITKEQRGNLSDLKRKGLVETFRDEGCDWIIFTPSGTAFASELGYTL